MTAMDVACEGAIKTLFSAEAIAARVDEHRAAGDPGRRGAAWLHRRADHPGRCLMELLSRTRRTCNRRGDDGAG